MRRRFSRPRSAPTGRGATWLAAGCRQRSCPRAKHTAQAALAAAVRGASATVSPRRGGKARRLPGAPGDFNTAALQAGAGPLFVCAGAFDALALPAAGGPRVVALCGVQGWRWAGARAVRELVLALDAAAAGPPPGRALARQAARLTAHAMCSADAGSRSERH